MPIGALHMVVCATIAMVDLLLTAIGIGIDTKWRTRTDGGCVQTIGAFTEQTEAKPSEGRCVEFSAGYVHHKYSTITVALANQDNYWYGTAARRRSSRDNRQILLDRSCSWTRPCSNVFDSSPRRLRQGVMLQGRHDAVQVAVRETKEQRAITGNAGLISWVHTASVSMIVPRMRVPHSGQKENKCDGKRRGEVSTCFLTRSISACTFLICFSPK